MPKRAIDSSSSNDRKKDETAGNKAERDYLDLEGGLNSPARQLQNYLDTELRGDADMMDRWSMRRTMSFVIITCGAFWFCAWSLTRLFLG